MADGLDSNNNFLRDLLEHLEDALRRLAADREQPAAPRVSDGLLLDCISLRLQQLQARFHMSTAETRILFIVAVRQLLPYYGRQLARAWSEDSVDGVRFSELNEILPDASGELAQAFSGPATLLRWDLLVTDGAAQSRADGPFFLDARLRAFLSGGDACDARVFGALQALTAPADLNALHLDPYCRRRVESLAAHWREPRGRRCVVFSGPSGAGQEESAAWIAEQTGRITLALNLESIAGRSQEGVEAMLLLAKREAVLQNAALLLIGIPEDPGFGPVLLELLDRAREVGTPIILCSESGRLPYESRYENVAEIRFTPPAWESRRAFWELALGATAVEWPDAAATLASRFRITRRKIAAAVELACTEAALQTAGKTNAAPTLAAGQLLQACQRLSRHGLTDLARKVETRFTWADLILPADTLGHLKEIEAHVACRDRVLFEWGYGANLTGGGGVHALFSGPPGTGKTMAASALGNALGLELYRIDLSSVVSKYIGETEKNLSRIFEAARDSNAILFFDEADALFGKRSEVKDSHDRYANIEVSYLLQKIEEYDGLTVLATNFVTNLDEAFRRRLHYLVEFPLPDVAERETIWRKTITPDTPIDGKIDFAFLAERMRLSGAGIVNIVVRAALFAANANEGLSMRRIMEAARREYQKEERPFLRADFEPYYPE